MKPHNIYNFSGIIHSKRTPHVLHFEDRLYTPYDISIWHDWYIFMFDILTVCC